ncbi:putative monooxygenase p33MONOX [Leucoraja erinacea]|uniref:putative monooxygenase p33MONOX n=1 Tax=Leucoraja erinaceus TaxID=7782 RepID=UPI002458CDA7|nr:putative monooxygenase p33MONOX [Leucoraja erinacea]XP_055499033.1 putative monooxygenase p33MONOX [Leucoraja erinacea]
MASDEHSVPAIEHSSGLLEKMSLPIGMHRRAFSYDDALADFSPMTPPPSDMGSSILWKQPVIPERKYQQLSMVEDGENGVPPSLVAPSFGQNLNKVHVVKAKATSVIMKSLMTQQTQESIQRFEKQAGLTDAGYQPHKGLVAEEASYHRVGEALQKFKAQSVDLGKEDKQISSTQSTPCGSPQSSPMPSRRSFFGQGASSDLSGRSMEGESTTLVSETTATEKWKPFMRSHTYRGIESGSFAIQKYKGMQKPSPMDIMRTQGTVSKIGEGHANLNAPKMELTIPDRQKRPVRSHHVEPRDLNAFAPTGF